MASKKKSIGKYRIVEELTRGPLGSVYRAEDTSRQHAIVALKLIHAVQFASAQERSAFLQEAQQLSMLKHPYILPVLDTGIDDQGFPYLVTAYAPNGSLDDRLKQQSPRPLPLQEVLTILVQLGQALHYAHQQNVIHRDLKPTNILFNANGDALLADFGLASILAASLKNGITTGNPHYMAPESFRGSVSQQGDQYALGCIAYELLSGRVPFTAPDFFALGFKHMSEPPFPPTQLNLLLPRSLEQAVLKAMAKRRADRHADMATFLAALGLTILPDRIPGLATAYTPPVIPQDYATLPAYTPPGVPLPAYTPPGAARIYTTPVSSSPPGQDEDNKEGDATVVRPLYSRVPYGANERVTPLPPSIAGPFDREEPGKALAPAAYLPRVLEGPRTGMINHAPTPLFSHPGPRRANSLEEDVRSAQFIEGFRPGAGAHNEDALRPIAVPMKILETPVLPSMYPGSSISGLPSPNHVTNSKQAQRVKSRWLIAATLALVLLLIAGSVLYAVSKVFNHAASPNNTALFAAVNITPTSERSVSNTYTFYAVTGTPRAGQHQVAARRVSATFSQSTTVRAFGQGAIPAVQARGTLTFYNDSTSPQPFSAGQVYTGHDGVQITNDAGGTVPAGNPSSNPPTWRSVTVSAHAIQPGQSGNIAATDVNKWTSNGPNSSFVVQNHGAFSGGKDAQPFSFVQQSDLDNAANPIQAALFHDALASLLAQERLNERLAASTSCTTHVLSSHPAGSRVSSVMATVSATCTGEVYDAQAAQSLAANLLARQIRVPARGTPTAHDTNPTLANNITTTVIQTKVVDAKGTLALLVKAASNAFSSAQKHELAKLIAGKSEQEAHNILLKQAGISLASIDLSGGDGNILPTNPDQIIITVLS